MFCTLTFTAYFLFFKLADGLFIMKPTTLKRYSMQVRERGIVWWTWLHGSVSKAGVPMASTGACHDHVPGTSISLEYEHQTV
ncbi:hypothetical protein EDB82DRAFT_515931 [Fusarium venenatum]|uniref:uncharacterized protein n=1 Tax=Fusarium venenatum TaxID=56646 RepID=UPI001DA9D6F2|nr:hypothetical protein EDB82DRAFT_515931 [Fusarium venenatum]